MKKLEGLGNGTQCWNKSSVTNSTKPAHWPLSGANMRNLRIIPRETPWSNGQVSPENTCFLWLNLQTHRLQNIKNWIPTD